MDLEGYHLPTRVVGFTYSHPESTLNEGESSTAKIRTQRSLLSELLAAQLIAGAEGEDETDSYADEATDDESDDEYAEVPPPTKQGVYGLISDPIEIPCTSSLANQRVKEAYRRLLYQRQIEQLYYQQQQQRLQQQGPGQPQHPQGGQAARGMPQGPGAVHGGPQYRAGGVRVY